MTIRIRILRHHHVAVELCPSNKASPRGLRGIIPFQEAPPCGLHGITPWPLGITTILTWNYVLMLRQHQGLPLRRSMESRPTDEAPPRALTTRVMELRPTHTLYMFTNQLEGSHNTNIMSKQPIIQFMLSNSCTMKQYIIFTPTSYINHDIIPQTIQV